MNIHKEKWGQEPSFKDFEKFGWKTVESVLQRLAVPSADAPEGQLNLFHDYDIYPTVPMAASLATNYDRRTKDFIKKQHPDAKAHLETCTLMFDTKPVFEPKVSDSSRGTVVFIFAPPLPHGQQRIFQA